MSADHYLAGACEGISLHRKGRTVTVKDRTGREKEQTHTFEDAERAAVWAWQKRDELYRQYDGDAVGGETL